MFTKNREERLSGIEAQAVRQKAPYVDLSQYESYAYVLKLIPHQIAERYNMLPLAINIDTLYVAVGDTADVQALDAARLYAGCKKVIGVRADAELIRESVRRLYRAPVAQKEPSPESTE